MGLYFDIQLGETDTKARAQQRVQMQFPAYLLPRIDGIQPKSLVAWYTLRTRSDEVMIRGDVRVANKQSNPDPLLHVLKQTDASRLAVEATLSPGMTFDTAEMYFKAYIHAEPESFDRQYARCKLFLGQSLSDLRKRLASIGITLIEAPTAEQKEQCDKPVIVDMSPATRSEGEYTI